MCAAGISSLGIEENPLASSERKSFRPPQGWGNLWWPKAGGMDTSPGISLDQLKNYEKLHEQWYGLANRRSG